MSTEDEGILAFLDCAITTRENQAQSAAVPLTAVPDGGAWEQRHDSHRGGYVISRHGGQRQEAVTESVAFSSEESAATFIALNDPASVLRRCAADRKLIELHAGWAHSCPAFDEAGDYDGQVHFYNHEICPTIRHLAEDYGWIGST